MTQNQLNALRIANAIIALKKGLLIYETSDMIANLDDHMTAFTIAADYMNDALAELEGRGRSDEADEN